MPKRITIQIVGAPQDREHVRFDDFISQLESVKRALRETERLISGQEESTVEYRVVDLRHSSPGTVVLEPILTDENRQIAEEIPLDFSQELSLIKNKGELLHKPEINRLYAYQELGTSRTRLITKVRVIVGRKRVTLDDNFKEKMEKIIGPDEVTRGSVSGMLEALNFHNTNKFTLYPVVGARRIAGAFPHNLRPHVKEAIGNYVTVFGKLKYKLWSPFPHAVVAEKVEIHPPESELPTLSQVRGQFKGLTGGLNSVEFVNRVRNENW